jgi:ATP-dependent Lhr-like helicase
MLVAYRRDIEPAPGLAFARFLWQWHQLGDRAHGTDHERRLSESLAMLEGLALSFAELETRILPARMADFRPSALDQLLATGTHVWVGAGAVSSRDGRVVLMRRASAATFIESPDPEAIAQRSDLERALLALLQTRGAVFFPELVTRLGAPSARVAEALWALVWAGLVTNDTLLPLRALGRFGDDSDAALVRTMAGRWCLVQELLPEGAEPVGTMPRATARALALAQRYGLAARELVLAEGGSPAGLYDSLRVLEDHGRLRRGYYLADLGPAQFALPGVVDRLREAGRAPPSGAVVLLAATDPAQPWGGVLAWPETVDSALNPRRQIGAAVALQAGEPLFWIAPKGDRIVTFPAARASDSVAVQAFRTLVSFAASLPARTLTVAEIDGASPRATRLEALLRAAGFTPDYRGMTLIAPTTPVAAS